eukprot:COSAG05_NODE_2856_length_2569_cov_8.796761_2_plen_544_part_00
MWRLLTLGLLIDHVHCEQQHGAQPPPAAPAGFAALLIGGIKDTSRGKVLRPQYGANLTQPGARWYHDHGNMSFTFQQTYADFGSYRLQTGSSSCKAGDFVGMCFARQSISGFDDVPLRPNRRYIVAATIRTSFPRVSAEIDLQMRLASADGLGIFAFDRTGGFPHSTSPGVDGWARWEWTFVTPPNIASGIPTINEYVLADTQMPSVEIADWAVIETSPVPVTPLPGISGAIFRGSVGELPMAVYECSVGQITTTAARYIFTESNSTIEAWQQIDAQRHIASWTLSVPLVGLRVLRFDPGPEVNSCVLGNQHLSIGVQPDGLLALIPHVESEITLTNKIGGQFNRFDRSSGDLLSEDDLGGLTANPHIPSGSGRLARCTVLTPGLAFTNDSAFDINSTAAAPLDWQIKWTLSSGERLFSSVMPVRPYDWSASFKFRWAETNWNKAANPVYANVTTLLLWDIASKVYSGTFTGGYVPYPNATAVKETVDGVHAAGKEAIAYMSAELRAQRNASEYHLIWTQFTLQIHCVCSICVYIISLIIIVL